MKKIIILSSLFLCLGLTVSAQQNCGAANVDQKCSDPAKTNRRGVSILPKAGDFAFGISAEPFLQYLGNSFNNTIHNQAPSLYGVDNTIYGKYFLENDRAIRAKLRFNIGSVSYKGVVPNDGLRASDPLQAFATAIDKKNFNSTDIELRVGYEWRRGRGRVQGFWGAEAGVGVNSDKVKYKYANAITALNQTPSTWDFSDMSPSVTSPLARVTEARVGTELYGTVAAFAGVEYFIAPNISLGGEFNLGLMLASTSEDKVTIERWDVANNKVAKQTLRDSSWTESYGGPIFMKKAGNAMFKTVTSGRIFVMFYF